MINLEGFVPDIDRVKTTLEHKEPDRVPNFETYVSRGVVEAILGAPLPTGLAGELAYRTRFRYDYLYIIPRYETPPVYGRSGKKTGNADGEISWADMDSKVITDWDSLRAYVYPEPGTLDLSELREAIKAARELPGNVGVAALMPAAPLMESQLLMGFEGFCMKLYEDFDLCKALVDRIGRTGCGSMEQLCREDIDVVFFGDDMAYTGGMMIAPDMMRELFFPWYRKFIAIARDAGKYVLFHSDGNIKPVIPDFIDAGLQGLNPIEPLAMDIVELKREFGSRLTLIGNIDVDLLARGTPEQIEEQVKQRIEQLAPGGGYMLASSNSVADYSKPENYAAMIEAGFRYGKY